jgi:hypothetical protein
MSQVKYIAKNTNNNGWTVVQRTGSRRKGFKDVQVTEAGMTCATACAIANQMTRDAS